MSKLKKNFIQVAGVLNLIEAQMLIKAGVQYIGFPLRLGYHKEDISETEAKEIISVFPPNVNAILISYEQNPYEIIKLMNKLNVKIIQIHSETSIDTLSYLKEIDPEIIIIKSLIVKNDNFDELSQQIDELTPYVDAFITDTYDEETGAIGATGKTHNWDISKKLVGVSKKPIILAGGLNPENVAEAIAYVQPYGVDVHTGVEDINGIKNKILVETFLKESI